MSGITTHTCAAAVMKGARTMVIIASSGLLTACTVEAVGPDNPVPVVESVTPASVPASVIPPPLMIRGQGFTPGSSVRLNGQDRRTFYADGGEVAFELNTVDVDIGGLLNVSVFNGPPGGGESNQAPLYIGHPTPAIASISPDRVAVGSGDTRVAIVGSGFLQGGGTQVLFDGTALVPAVASPDSLTVVVPGQALESSGYFELRVSNAPPGEGLSNAASFSVGSPAPVLASVSPDTVAAGTEVSLVLVGQRLHPDTRVRVNGVLYQAMEVEADSLVRFLASENVFSTDGPAELRLHTPEPGGGDSAPLEITVLSAPPSITSWIPSAIAAGSGAQTVRVVGSGFRPDSEVSWNGVPVPAVVSQDQLRIDLEAQQVTMPGSGRLSVTAAGTATAQATVPIVPSVPTIFDTILVALPTNDVASDPVRDVVYATVPAGASTYENEMVAFDPTDGSVLWSTPIGSDPRDLVVTDDGSFAYVALGGAPIVVRVDLDARLKVLEIPIEPSDLGTDLATDLVALPGAPRSIVASLTHTCCPSHAGVVVYDDDVPRPVRSAASPRIEPSSHGGKIYSFNNESTEWGLRRMSIDSDGIREEAVIQGLIGGFLEDIVFEGGFLFVTLGVMVDPENFTIVRTFASAGRVRPDVDNGRVHFFNVGASRISTTNLWSGEVLGYFVLPYPDDYAALDRYGPDGLVFGGASQVLFIRSELFGS